VILFHVQPTTTDINQNKQNGITEINSNKSDFKIRIENSENEDISLPAGSPFTNWKEARRFAGPLPFTFTYNPVNKKILIIEGVRENWKPKPVKVIDYNFSFIDNLKLNDVRLANAFIIRNVPYYWKKGKIEQWKKKEENFKAFKTF